MLSINQLVDLILAWNVGKIVQILFRSIYDIFTASHDIA